MAETFFLQDENLPLQGIDMLGAPLDIEVGSLLNKANNLFIQAREIKTRVGLSEKELASGITSEDLDTDSLTWVINSDFPLQEGAVPLRATLKVTMGQGSPEITFGLVNHKVKGYPKPQDDPRRVILRPYDQDSPIALEQIGEDNESIIMHMNSVLDQIGDPQKNEDLQILVYSR